MSTGDRTSYEILAVQLGMAGRALTGNANIEHKTLFELSEAHGGTGGIVAELAALRQRASDLELMLRAVIPAHQIVRVWHSYGESVTWKVAGLLDHVPDDGTGLPLLTAEARSALLSAVKGG
jgi:hypothetical protein